MLKKSKLKKFWRSLTGKATPRKKSKLKRRTVTGRRTSLYSQRRGRVPALRKRRLSEFEKGFDDARKLTSSWNSQPTPPQVYIDNTRVHHGEVGVVLGVAGILAGDERLTGLGTGLAVDDLHDASEWFTFKQRNYYQNGFV